MADSVEKVWRQLFCAHDQKLSGQVGETIVAIHWRLTSMARTNEVHFRGSAWSINQFGWLALRLNVAL
jgi:hypothetical protein